MIDHNRWRDQQISGFNLSNKDVILEQEQVMLNFVKQYNIRWKWLGNNTGFKRLCERQIQISNDAQGVIIFGTCLENLSTNKLVERLRHLTSEFDYAYVAINRYEVTHHNIDLALPDGIAESIDAVMNYCNPLFKRLHNFAHVDGNHMVAAHPMDCYGLCKL